MKLDHKTDTWVAAEDDDLPLAAPRDVPGWMESYHFFGYDPAAEVGFWCNLSSSQWDHSVWREVVIVFLPDGQLLVGKGWGGRSAHTSPSSAGLVFNCVMPQRSWRIRLNSALQPVAAEQTFRGRVSDDARIPAALGLDVTCSSPPWRLPFGPEPDAWYAQRIAFAGTLRVDGRELELTGTGFRDHSRGPRDFGVAGGHTLVSVGSGPDDWLQLMQVRAPESRQVLLSVASGAAGDSQARLDVAPLAAPPWPPNDGPTTETLELTRGGRAETVVLESVADVALTLKGPNEFLFGVDPDSPDLVSVESVVAVRSGSVTGYGLLERAARPAGCAGTGNNTRSDQ